MRAAMSNVGSEYLQWVKTRTPARFNLSASGVQPCTFADLGARLEDLEINRSGGYGYEPLQLALAKHCGVGQECVVSAAGTSMANFIAMAALIEPGDEVLIEYPVYEPLIAVARYLQADIKRLPRDGRPRDFVSSRTRLIVVTNLHNPTCSRFDELQLEELAQTAKAVGARVLIDEVYLECMFEKASTAFHMSDVFVATASLTKAYGLGGLRCGWILAEPDLVRRIWQFKDLVDPSALHSKELLSVIALRNIDRLAGRARSLIDTNRKLLRSFLESCSQLEVEMPEYGTCVFPRVKSGNADRLFDMLRNDYDTEVVPGRFFEMSDHFRLGLGMEADVFAEGLTRLEQAMGRL
jgi:aspartate/methionine/tyrosine aminotransferase